MEFQKIRGKKHFVFENRKEFEEHFKGLNEVPPTLVENWRLAKKGDWVLADDGGIVQIIFQSKLSHPNDRKRYKNHRGYCRTIVGTFIQDDKYEMDTDFTLHPNRYRFGSATDADIKYRQKNRDYLSSPELVFVAALCSGKTLQQSYQEYCKIINMPFPHPKWQRKAIGLLKRERIMTAINKNVEEIAEKLGIDFKYILSGLKQLFEESDNDNIKLGSLKELAEWLGGKDKMKQVTRGQVHVFEPFSGEELAKIEAEKIEAIEAGEED